MTATTIAPLPLEIRGTVETAQSRFETLVSTYSADLYRFAYWLCRNKEVAEDLVQETFLRAWRSMDSLRDAKASKAWLLTILRREHARHYERERPAFDDIEADTLAGWDPHDTRPEAFVLRRAIGELPVRYREPLVLQILGGYSTAEIGEILGLSRAAVMTRVFRAKQKLRAVLDGAG